MSKALQWICDGCRATALESVRGVAPDGWATIGAHRNNQGRNVDACGDCLHVVIRQFPALSFLPREKPKEGV